jgi:hypothetical protein
MKTVFAAALAAILVFPTAPATAQTLEAPAQAKINLTLQQKYVIREIIKDAAVEPVQSKQDLSIGAEVSTSVKLQAIPAEIADKVPQIKSHMFFIADKKIVLVEPGKRKIDEVIDR